MGDEKQVQKLCKEVASQLEKKNLEKAFELIKTTLNLNPNSSSALRYLGLYYSYKQNCEKAVENLEKAFQLDPRSADIATELAGCYQILDVHKAIFYSEAALKIDPNHDRAKMAALGYLALGVADLEKKNQNLPLAMEYYNKFKSWANVVAQKKKDKRFLALLPGVEEKIKKMQAKQVS